MMNLSRESEHFLENLRVYLISSGKKEQEVQAITEELEDHLCEAEKNGKNIDDIIGKSPKEYMDQIASEMSFDLKGLIQYIPIIMFGAFAFILTGKAIRGVLEFSLVEVIGYPLICLLYLLATALIFKYVSSRALSKIKEGMIVGITGILPLGLFLLLLYVNDLIHTPTLAFGIAGNIVALICAVVIFISVAVWSKSWTFMIIPLLLFLPEGLLNLTSLPTETKAILSIVISFGLIGIYLFIIWIQNQKKGKKIQDDESCH